MHDRVQVRVWPALHPPCNAATPTLPSPRPPSPKTLGGGLSVTCWRYSHRWWDSFQIPAFWSFFSIHWAQWCLWCVAGGCAVTRLLCFHYVVELSVLDSTGAPQMLANEIEKLTELFFFFFGGGLTSWCWCKVHAASLSRVSWLLLLLLLAACRQQCSSRRAHCCAEAECIESSRALCFIGASLWNWIDSANIRCAVRTACLLLLLLFPPF